MTKVSVIAFKVVSDLCCGILAFLPWILLKTIATPFKRGFFCDDESLRHPYYDSTVSSTLATSLSIIIPLVIIEIVEMMRSYCYRRRSDPNRSLLVKRGSLDYDVHPFLVNSYSFMAVFLFGAAANESITNIGKYAVGRLRPHFFDICRPNITADMCVDSLELPRYVTEDVCTGTDAHRLKEMRLSFPSGHASLTMYAAVFAIIYLNRRFTVRWSKLFKNLLQLAFFLMALAVGFTRMSDYKHHWSDVLAGFLLGATIAYLVLLPGSLILKDKTTDTLEEKISILSKDNSHQSVAAQSYRSVEDKL